MWVQGRFHWSRVGPHAVTETQSQAETQVGSGMVAHTCHSSTWKVEAVGAGIQGYPWLDGEFEASLGYLRLCYKTTEQRREELEARTRDKSQPKGQWRFLGTPRCCGASEGGSVQTSLQNGEIIAPVVFCPSPVLLCCSCQITDNPPALWP